MVYFSKSKELFRLQKDFGKCALFSFSSMASFYSSFSITTPDQNNTNIFEIKKCTFFLFLRFFFFCIASTLRSSFEVILFGASLFLPSFCWRNNNKHLIKSARTDFLSLLTIPLTKLHNVAPWKKMNEANYGLDASVFRQLISYAPL